MINTEATISEQFLSEKGLISCKCGSSNLTVYEEDLNDIAIQCVSCSRLSIFASTIEKAIELWNHRKIYLEVSKCSCGNILKHQATNCKDFLDENILNHDLYFIRCGRCGLSTANTQGELNTAQVWNNLVSESLRSS